MATAEKTPAKTTAKKSFKPLPFGDTDPQGKTVVMPNGQTVKHKEVLILKGMLQLELNSRSNGSGETAVAIAQMLLGSKKKLPTLMQELVDFIISNQIISIKK